jgi:CHAT domain-containing protein
LLTAVAVTGAAAQTKPTSPPAAAAADEGNLDAELDALIAELNPPTLEEILSRFGPYPTDEELSKLASSTFDAAMPDTIPVDAAQARGAALQKQIDDLCDLGDFEQAAARAQDLCELQRRTNGDEHWTAQDARSQSQEIQRLRDLSRTAQEELVRARGLDQAAARHFAAAHYSEAAPLLLEALNIKRRYLGQRSRAAAAAMHDLGFMLARAGNFKAARRLYLASASLQRELLGERNPAVATTLNNLGYLLANHGDSQAAIALAGKAAVLRCELFGSAHADIVASLNAVAIAFLKAGDYARAEQLFRAIWAERQHRYGENDPRALGAAQALADVLKGQRAYEEAAALLEKVLAVKQGQYRAPHPEMADTLSKLAQVYSDQRRYAQAEALYREALAIYRETLGEEHVSVAGCLNDVAALLDEAGDFPAAVGLYRDVLARFTRIYGEEHVETALVRHNLSVALAKQADFDGAEVLSRHALMTLQRSLGESHPQVATVLHHLAQIVDAQGHVPEAIELCRQALDIRQRVFGRDHVATAAVMGTLAHLLERDGSPHSLDEAEALLGQVLRAKRARHDPTLYANATVYASFLQKRRDRVAAALPLYAEAIEQIEQLRRLAREDALFRSTYFSALTSHGTFKGAVRAELALAETAPSEPALEHRRRALDFLERGRAIALLDLLARAESRVADHVLGLEAAAPSATSPRPMTSTELCSHLATGELLLTYDVDDEDAVLLVGSASGDVEAYALSWPDANKVTVVALRAAMGQLDPYENDGTSANVRLRTHGVEELSSTLIPPAVGRAITAAKRVFVVADGPLHQLPFEMLVLDPKTGQRWLDVGPPIVYGPSATVIMTERQRAQEHRNGSSDRRRPALVAVGDPLFSRPSAAAPPTPPDHGVLLAQVTSKGNADAHGLRAGDVLLAYDGEKLAGPAELGPAIQKAGARRQEDQAAQRLREEAEAQVSRGPERDRTEQAVPRPTATSAPADQVPVVVWRAGQTLALAVAPGKLGVQPSQASMPLALQDYRELQLTEDERVVKYASAATRDGFGELKPLPGTRAEIDALARLMKRANIDPDAVKVLAGEEATLTRLGEVADQPRFLHFATHALAESGPRVYESALALTVPVEPTPADFGFLRLQDLLDHWGGKLQGTELVVLSGCQTARGRLESADGFVGLTWGFLFAGADSVIASLWKVDDAATALLMNRLYENLLGTYAEPRGTFAAHTPMPKADALHEAKRWLRSRTPAENRAALAGLGLDVEQLTRQYRAERGRLPSDDPEPLADPFDFSAPRFWAAFVLIGNPD